MRDYTKYEIWNLGIELSVKIFRITGEFPNEEKFGLTSQISRALVSIFSNITEGASRSSEKEFNRFIEIAFGSSFELKSQILLAGRLNYTESQNIEELIKEIDLISKKLNALRNKLNRN